MEVNPNGWGALDRQDPLLLTPNNLEQQFDAAAGPFEQINQRIHHTVNIPGPPMYVQGGNSPVGGAQELPNNKSGIFDAIANFGRALYMQFSGLRGSSMPAPSATPLPRLPPPPPPRGPSVPSWSTAPPLLQYTDNTSFVQWTPVSLPPLPLGCGTGQFFHGFSFPPRPVENCSYPSVPQIQPFMQPPGSGFHPSYGPQQSFTYQQPYFARFGQNYGQSFTIPRIRLASMPLCRASTGKSPSALPSLVNHFLPTLWR